MSRRTEKRRVRATAVARAGWAGVLLVVPEVVLRAGGPAPVPAAAVAVARVLAARHLLQATASALAPTGSVVRLGAAVDTLHTGTCVALAAVSPRWRRAALLDSVVEAAFAAASWRTSSPRRG